MSNSPIRHAIFVHDRNDGIDYEDEFRRTEQACYRPTDLESFKAHIGEHLILSRKFACGVKLPEYYVISFTAKAAAEFSYAEVKQAQYRNHRPILQRS